MANNNELDTDNVLIGKGDVLLLRWDPTQWRFLDKLSAPIIAHNVMYIIDHRPKKDTFSPTNLLATYPHLIKT